MNLLKGPWFLKLAALVVALVTYFYIHKEMEMNTAERRSFAKNFAGDDGAISSPDRRAGIQRSQPRTME